MLRKCESGNLKGRDHSEDLGVDGKKKMRTDLRKKRLGRYGLDSYGSRSSVAGLGEHGNESLRSIKIG
jgi:hypothetical protein